MRVFEVFAQLNYVEKTKVPWTLISFKFEFEKIIEIKNEKLPPRQLDRSFNRVEAAVLPLGGGQRMLAAELQTPGTYILRIKLPFFPLGSFDTCRAVKIRLQVSPESMVWADLKFYTKNCIRHDFLPRKIQKLSEIQFKNKSHPTPYPLTPRPSFHLTRALSLR